VIRQEIAGSLQTQPESEPIKKPSRLKRWWNGPGLPAPTTEEEYDALPSGTQYRHPDGTIRTKP